MRFVWLFVVYAVVLIIISVFLYYQFFKKKEVKTENKTETCDIYYFYTSWCPYCIKARPEWDKFKKYWNNKKKGNYVLLFSEVDCDKNESLALKYEVEKYPCIKLVKDGNVYDYDAKPTLENLNQFLNMCFE
jgi:thiol-disulfide isomerase/thioredoxin